VQAGALRRGTGETIRAALLSAVAAGVPLIPLGTHALRGIASPCAVFTAPEN